ncbi:hypothetical protein T231_01405 [Tannerella sp. oral taxon BU063 isolate Cell 6/7/9]|uniref:Uncharacterized protein n=1 Tax=Tannerella sp. oral taxon BU063 isolate Cell 6/7/9 TaxID=1411021 RepID=W2CX56_9BACT|nr:hypothetical protein T231_01405 [Tannerella sp. oral taxon BU063 isolate Cell 6/7/9]
MNSVGSLKTIIPKKCLTLLGGWNFALRFSTDEFLF